MAARLRGCLLNQESQDDLDDKKVPLMGSWVHLFLPPR